MSAPKRDPRRYCGLCGEPAAGYAMIDDQRYCHGDATVGRTCYERAEAGAFADATAYWARVLKRLGTHAS